MIFELDRAEMNKESIEKLCRRVVGYLTKTRRRRYVYYSRWDQAPEIKLRMEEYSHDSGIWFGEVEFYWLDDFLYEGYLCPKEELIKTLYDAVCTEWLDD